VTYKNEHWIYYGGASERHYSIGRDMKIGLAKLRLDGFMCLEAKDTPGRVVTKPFVLEGDTLQVNVDASGGRFYAEVLDADGKAIPGFGAKQAQFYDDVDELLCQPKWNSGHHLAELKGKTVRLRFHLRHAKLYAFQVK
jgi:hypothetical protein